MKRIVLLITVFLFFAGSMPLFSQVKPKEDTLLPEEYDPDEFPLWAHDVRRFEVITFGAFPVAFFFSSLVYDVSIAAQHGFSSGYDLGTQRDTHDITTIIVAAVGVSVGVAIADLIITLSKRNNPERKRLAGIQPVEKTQKKQ